MREYRFLVLIGLAWSLSGNLKAQSPVILSPLASPATGQPGVTSVNITGSNFPAGTIPAANVSVTLAPAAGGPVANTSPSAVTTIVGSTRRVTFTIPAAISVTAPTAYNVSISGTTTSGAAFASSNTASLTVNPSGSILSVNPNSGTMGQSLAVNLTGQFTNWVQGATLASFGAGISVGGGPLGGFGPLAVAGMTIATAQITIDPSAASGTRTLTIITGAQQATLANGFTVTVGSGTPVISSVTPNTGQPGQTLPTVAVVGQFTNFVNGTTVANFGAGITVNLTTVMDPTHATVNITILGTATPGGRTVTMTTGTEAAILGNGFSVTVGGGPTITDFNPKSAPIGTLVTITGANLQPNSGTAAQVTLAKQGGGTIVGAVSNAAASSLTFVIPAGAATGPLVVAVNGNSASTASPLTIVPSSTFTLTAVPGSADLIQGQSTAYAVSLTSGSGFDQLTALSVTGLPSGVNASFKPQQITAGQTSVLSLIAPAGQPTGSATLTVSASATVDGIAVVQSATPTLNVKPVTTSFLGRTVVSDSLETPLANVTILMLGKDGNGGTTGCTGGTVSDGAGNFLLTNLPPSCIGPQLVGFDGTTATTPAGKYAGVNLVFTFASGQVTVSPVLVHLPRIDNVETFFVTQNSPSNQSRAFTSIPGLSVTVYAGTTFTMPDGSQPNPFPLAAIQVPVDRLPDAKPQVPTMMRVFIVAFQPANATASLPVAVFFPNVNNTPPGTNMALMTLDPTHGTMVPYGTGTVSADATQVVPDADPAHPGHLYGLVHFDWHGQMPPPPNQPNPGPPGGGPGNGGGPTSGPGPGPGGGSGPGGPNPGPGPSPGLSPGAGGGPGGCTSCPCNALLNPVSEEHVGGFLARNQESRTDPSSLLADPPAQAGDPVDLYSGIQTITNADISINGSRGSIAVVRNYRSLTSVGGPFGIGTNHNYSYTLDTFFPQAAVTINLIMPDGNRFPFSPRFCPGGGSCGKSNTTIPALQGAVMTANGDNTVDLRWKNGSVYHFVPGSFVLGSLLASIKDPNGNTITITRDAAGKVTTVTDPVGRSLTFAYDSAGRITSIADPIGRSVQYGYNSQGSLATVTDPAGGVTHYAYDPNNNMIQVTDARGIIQAQNTLDSTGRVIKQVRPDGGVLNFSYGLLNPLVASSQALQAQVTDSQGVQAIYRFNQNGFVTDVTATQGQTRHIERAPGTNLLASIVKSSSALTYTYDGNGNVLSTRDATGHTTQFSYDPVFNKVTAITDPSGKVSLFTYDANGNLLTSTDANGHSSSYQYDPTGLLIQSTDALNQKNKFTYDGFGNLSTVSDPLGNTTSYLYDGISRLTATKDSLGRQTAFTYDFLGRLLTRTDAKGGVTTFTYDPNGNLLSAKDARGNTTTFTYDVMNRLTTRMNPLSQTDTSTYDTNGNLVKFVDRRGQISTFAYDSLNRLVGETYLDASVTRTYDVQGRLAQVNDSVGGNFTFSYDLAGRLLSSSTPFGTVNYSYDGRGAMVSRQVAGQPAVSYAYDPAGNPVSAAMPQASMTFAYTPRNQLSSISRLNGVSSTYTYDADARLLTLTHARGTSILDAESYTYDAVGNRAGRSTTIAQSLITQPTVNQYNAANQLTLFGAVPDSYDANGNLVQEGSATAYTWDSRNRLKSIMTALGQTTTFTYDFDGNLIAQADSGTSLNLTKSFVLDDLTNVAYESASDGTSYSVLSGRSIDSHLATVQSNGQIQYGLSDAVNSTIATVDQTGAVTSQFFYEAYGQSSGTGGYPFQFTGRMPVSGSLDYYRARFYNSQTGRFISEDPIGFSAGDSNLYRYARNSPVSLRDPYGYQATYLGYGPPVVSGPGTTVNVPYSPPGPGSQLPNQILNLALRATGLDSLATDIRNSDVPNFMLDLALLSLGDSPQGFVLSKAGYLLNHADAINAWLNDWLTKNVNLNVQFCLNPQPH